MSRVPRNILANFAGNGWVALVSLAFVPVYIHFMGIESYGLVGLFTSLYALFALLDAGLGTTLNRELARRSTTNDDTRETLDLVRSLECVFWGIAGLAAVAVAAMAPVITHHWLQPGTLPPAKVQQAITAMSVAMAFQLLTAFYGGGLMGLQRQVLLNGVKAASATARGVGAVLVLWLVSPTILAFFLWQGVVSGVQAVLTGWLLWRHLPRATERRRVSFALLKKVWRFAAGTAGTVVLGVLLTQMDKIILSRLLSLKHFGYYALASVVAMSLYRLVSPIFSAMYPRFTQLVAIGDTEALTRTYHRGCQLMSVIVLPLAALIALFSDEVLMLWTRDPAIVTHTAPILSLLIIGTALNATMNLPYAIQLAYGWTRLGMLTNLAAVAILVPLVYVLARAYGAVGAATGWVLLNLAYLLITPHLMHRRLLVGEKLAWYWTDLGAPVLAVAVSASLCRWALPEVTTPLATSLTLATAFSLIGFAGIAAMPELRHFVMNRVRRLRRIPIMP